MMVVGEGFETFEVDDGSYHIAVVYSLLLWPLRNPTGVIQILR